MSKFTLPLVQKKEIACRTMGFVFETDGQTLTFKPGQFIQVPSVNPPYQDAQGTGQTLPV